MSPSDITDMIGLTLIQLYIAAREYVGIGEFPGITSKRDLGSGFKLTQSYEIPDEGYRRQFINRTGIMNQLEHKP